MRRKHALRSSLEEIAAILDGTDQRYWAGVLRTLHDKVDEEPGRVARDVLRLYEGPRAPRGAVDGEWALDTVPVTRGGNAYTVNDPVLWALSLRYAQLLSEVYQDALHLWQACDVARVEMPGRSAEWLKLVDYGGGSEVWQRGEDCRVRYDCGAHRSLVREDSIGRDEAEQAMLGPKHFLRMIVALQNRLQKAGVDPYQGNAMPLPELE